MAPLLELCNIACLRDGQPVFRNVNLVVNQGDVVVVRGKSGCGKTTLLKCIAHLVLYDGHVLYRGSPPKALGIPAFRTKILYVPQRPSMLPGTPRDFLTTITSLDAHKAHPPTDDPFTRALDISRQWHLDPALWHRDWSNLSGGEAQRIALAIAVGLNTAELILLDEPTSALDSVTTAAVESHLLHEVRSAETTLKAIVWITHSEEQAGRVGTKFIQITAAGCIEEPIPVV